MYVDTMDQFNEQLTAAGSKLVVVDFTASWCGPCRMIAPILAQAAQNNPDIVVLKVDVDENEEVTQMFQIAAMPTFIFIKNGQAVHKFSGASEQMLLEAIAKLK